MTRRRKLKRRIRQRMARTGEAYSTARAVFTGRAKSVVSGPPVVVIPVSDMPRAIEFYRDLGFELLGRNDDDSWAELGDGTTKLGLHPGASTGVETGLGLVIAQDEPFEQTVQQRGGRVVERAGPITTIHDPDGNVLRVMTGVRP